jgi:transposase-like protein
VAPEKVDFEVKIPVVEFEQLKCPFCGSPDHIQIYGHLGPRIRYARCKRCVYTGADRDEALRGDYTRFKVLLK